jgi:hypothetical protein
MLKKLLFILLLSGALLVPSALTAQTNIKDSLVSASFFSFNYGYHTPGGDLAKRFGNNSSAGINYFRKTKSNWIFGVDFNYLFGGDIKETTLFDSIITDRGQIVDRNGNYSDIRVYERGIHFTTRVGKVIPLFGPNKNSGIIITAGPGFLQHKIRIETLGNKTPQLNDDYKKGYDRLTNGLSLTEFIGYQHLSNRRLINYFIGFEFTQAFTQSRRDYNFDTMKKDTEKRIDLLQGIKAGFIIPIYRRAPKEFYYN